MPYERKCEVCGADCRRKKVGSQYNRDVICLSCHAQGWRFEDDGNLCTLPPYQPASNTEALRTYCATMNAIYVLLDKLDSFVDAHGYIEPDAVTWDDAGALGELLNVLGEAVRVAGIDSSMEHEFADEETK